MFGISRYIRSGPLLKVREVGFVIGGINLPAGSLESCQVVPYEDHSDAGARPPSSLDDIEARQGKLEGNEEKETVHTMYNKVSDSGDLVKAK